MPFVVIQVIMVAIVVMFPNIVMHYKGSGVKVDPAAVQKSLDDILMPGLPGDGGLPGLNFDTPPKIP